MVIFTEEEIDKGLYTNFMRPNTRIGYEIQFSSIIPMMSDNVNLSRLYDGEWLYIDGIVKDAVAKFTFFIMSQFGYVESQAPIPDKANALLSKGKIITQSVIKLVVFDIISNSPYVVNLGSYVIDHNKLHSLLINLKSLMRLEEYKKMKFIGDMFMAAVKLLLKDVDEYNKRFIDTKRLC